MSATILVPLDGSAASSIVEVASQEQAGMIVMATHGRGGLARLVLGSVATATLQRAAVPLLLVRPGVVQSPVVLAALQR